ncbi:type III secretion system export apparatus subunit SctR [Kaustia mangrovi]|uniref:Type III secretion system export apparatus subunit SctR n=1 Tax=Kaustia mangrovi TaxID=2593653 RepID=A0A7S8HDI5_9HYPH|nr:type III secretion system export apparatus subunit SctR [Kaustia mangrovi]QPC44323.1 type III secretion system export apparatus subunit SctR [Kaustia mangrovi]
MAENFPAILPTIIAIMALSLIPFLAVMGTAFTKISIVLMLVRNAIGVQQAPSGLVINSIALTLTVFIMAPVADTIVTQVQQQGLGFTGWENVSGLFSIVSDAFTGYLQKFSTERETRFFMDAAEKMWPARLHGQIAQDNLFILLPAHVTSELTRAFQIAFLIFLPFVIVDMVVSNILLAMGAMMVPPMLVSLPIKILLFVAADGWALLLHNLVLSYAQ